MFEEWKDCRPNEVSRLECILHHCSGMQTLKENQGDQFSNLGTVICLSGTFCLTTTKSQRVSDYGSELG